MSVSFLNGLSSSLVNQTSRVIDEKEARHKRIRSRSGNRSLVISSSPIYSNHPYSSTVVNNRFMVMNSILVMGSTKQFTASLSDSSRYILGQGHVIYTLRILYSNIDTENHLYEWTDWHNNHQIPGANFFRDFEQSYVPIASVNRLSIPAPVFGKFRKVMKERVFNTSQPEIIPPETQQRIRETLQTFQAQYGVAPEIRAWLRNEDEHFLDAIQRI